MPLGPGFSTVISDVPDAAPALTVTVAIPSPTPVTSPDSSTRATATLLDAQRNTASRTRWPFSSNACAASRRVSPSAIVAAGGDTMTDAADCITVTIAAPEAAPAVAVIVAAPPPTAVTSPTESTVATSVSALDHDTVTSSIGRLIWSRTSAASRIFWPTPVNAIVSGVTARVVGARGATASAAAPTTPDDVAVISASPAANAVTRPSPSTMATSVSLDAHVNSAPATAWPFASDASAESRRVSATTSVSAAGVTATALTDCATVTAAVPDAEPDLAVIVALPLAAAVTWPEASTAATEALLLDQATDAPAMTPHSGRAPRPRAGPWRRVRRARPSRGSPSAKWAVADREVLARPPDRRTTGPAWRSS